MGEQRRITSNVDTYRRTRQPGLSYDAYTRNLRAQQAGFSVKLL